MDENGKFEQLVNDFLEDYFKRNPSYATFYGKKEYAKEIEQGTQQHLEENVAKIKQLVQALEELHLEALTFENILTLEALKFWAKSDSFDLNDFPSWKKIPLGILEALATFIMLLQREGPSIELGEIMIARLNKISGYLTEYETRFDGSPIPKIWKELALKQVKGVPSLFHFLETVFSEVGDLPKNLKTALQQAIANVQPVIQAHIAWIEGLPEDQAAFAWALGTEKFDKVLAERQLPWKREAILQKGYDLLRSLKARAEQIAKEIDPTKTYAEMIEALKVDHPPTFEMVLEHTRSEAERAKQFIQSHDLVTIPKDESLVILETPEFLRPFVSVAGYWRAPYFDATMPGIFYMTPPPDEAGMKKFSYQEITFYMVHEAYPGHHLDAVTNRALPFPRVRALRDEISEGWAHYCEEMMLHQGFYDDPKKAELVIVNGQIWRAVRVIVDIELHCKQRTIEDAVKLLKEETYLDQQTAEAQIHNYTLYPSGPLSYLIGKLLIEELLQEVQTKLGEKFSYKFFHDTILQGAGLPYPILQKVFDYKIGQME
ncbi:MAG: DUF885 domain-containing protein [Promethearchaeota archaeon]